MYLKHVITAGILSAALAIGPGAAFAQSAGSTSGSSQATGSESSNPQGTATERSSSPSTPSQGSSAQPSSTQSSTQSSQSSSQGSSGADQDAVRQHLTSAREALAELTKLPAAAQLQGEQRQQVAQFISDFNAFATATTDWRPKYDAVDKSLDQLLGLDDAAAPSASASGSAPGASTGSTADAATPAPSDAAGAGAVGTSGTEGSGGLDPTIEAKLREVRTHLDQFEEASGDPTFVVEKIEKILDQASTGASAGSAVGTSGTAAAGPSDGAVTLSASQVQEIRRQLDSIKAAAKR